MKKALCFILSMCFAVGLVGCGTNSVDMPWDLSFGQSHEEVINAAVDELWRDNDLQNFDPEDKKEDGYSISHLEDPPSWDFLHSETFIDILEDLENSAYPELGFVYTMRFNDNKELYEIELFFQYDEPNTGEDCLFSKAIAEMTEYYDEAVGVEAEVKNYADGIAYLWKNDELSVLVEAVDYTTTEALVALTLTSVEHGME